MSSKYLNELFYHESDFSFDKIEPFFFTAEMRDSLPKVHSLPKVDTIEPSPPPSSVIANSHIEDSITAASPPTQNILYDPSPVHSSPPIKNTHKKPLFEPSRPDKLFWCIFTHIYGQEEYDSIGHSYGNRALEEKTKIGSHIKKNAAAFKTSSNYKITNIMIQEIQSELMTMHSKTSHIEMIAIAFFYGIEITLCFENNTYMTFGKPSDNSEIIPCIIYVKGNTYKLEMEPNLECLRSMFKHHHYLRPLNAISNYKTEELYDIWHMLGMPAISNKMKKQDIYQGIVEYLVK